jgi:hypothetical protein
MLALAVSAGLGLLAAGVLPVAAADDVAATEIAKTHLVREGEGGRYSGKIKSEEKRCLKERKVKVIHLSDPPFTIGRTETDADGYWELHGNIPPAGTPQKIKVIVAGSHHGDCKAAKETYKLSEILR